MKNKLFLLTPGPTNIPKSVFDAMCIQTHHSSQNFMDSLQYCRTTLPLFFQNDNPTILLASSGTGAMEAAITNTLSPNEKIIVLESGQFGMRFTKIGKSLGLNTIIISSEPGTAPDPQQLKEALKNHPDTKAVTACHCETATGVLAPIKEYGEIVAETPALYIVDTVATAGAMAVNQKENLIDICIAASQKGFMSPPGCGLLSLNGEKVFRAIASSKLPKLYFDLLYHIERQEMLKADYTPSTHTILAMEKALQIMIEEGIENGYQRRHEVAQYVRERGQSLGFQQVVKDGYIPSDSVTTFITESICDSQELIKKLWDRNIMAVPGIGVLKHKTIRIGTLGMITKEEMTWVFDQIEECLK